jgi:bifunctional UDP-N-acetylglucosamine pyrophosphorylase/glucosamine-1-phosphate N-acetyltransferase
VWWRDLAAAADRLACFDGAVELGEGARVSPSATLDTSQGSIVIGDRTQICDGATIVGPVVIGSDCLVGNLAMVRGTTLIGDGVRIGFGTEIKNAHLGNRVTIGPQCFVADSIVEDDAYLGAQVRTSNHRLDRELIKVMVDGQSVDTGLEKLGCRIGARTALGIQVIILPGRIVPPDSIFGPRITIEKNLPAGRYRQAQALQSY